MQYSLFYFYFYLHDKNYKPILSILSKLIIIDTLHLAFLFYVA